jgi:hypothetical protein
MTWKGLDLTLLIKALTYGAFISFALAMLYFLLSRMSPGAKAFWTGVFSDDGNPSFSRVATMIILVACLVWDTYIVFYLRTVPDLASQALFLGTPYGLNVGGKAIGKFATPGAGPAPATNVVVQQNQ